ncbi:MAG: PKD domain-containing protein [Bacillota bacterium]
MEVTNFLDNIWRYDPETLSLSAGSVSDDQNSANEQNSENDQDAANDPYYYFFANVAEEAEQLGALRVTEDVYDPNPYLTGDQTITYTVELVDENLFRQALENVIERETMQPASTDNCFFANIIKGLYEGQASTFEEVIRQAAAAMDTTPPSVGPIMAPIDPVLVNTEIQAGANFTDPDSDAHTAAWDWGDGTASAGIVSEVYGSGSVSGSHAYTSAGVYTVGVTVTDPGGNTGQCSYNYIVVYDPSSGYVTGGGWINSPEGAYASDPALTGKASFGFVSKYQKGAIVPTGQTEFQFKVADLNFHSDSYDWLVIAGAKAQYKGTGTINGAGNYGFMLTAVDGQINGGGGADKFRIKIWDKNNSDAVVYDNQIGDSETADPVTALGGGSIVIHKE